MIDAKHISLSLLLDRVCRKCAKILSITYFMMAKNLSISQCLHWFLLSVHIIYIDIGVYDRCHTARLDAADWAENTREKKRRKEMKLKHTTVVMIRKVKLISQCEWLTLGAAQATVSDQYLNSFFEESLIFLPIHSVLESNLTWFIQANDDFFHIRTIQCYLGCKCCDCHLRRPIVIFYFSLFLAVQNFECFGIILTDK